ncbi:hypothetical protein Tco_0425410 [Tanacetum coccineum]
MSDGQSGTLVGQGSACNRGCGHRLPSARVLRKCLICVRLEISAASLSWLSGSSQRFRDTPASSAAICFFRGYLLLSRCFVVPVRLGSDLFLLFTMSNITDIKYVLTQKGLDIFCHKFHILGDVHPQLPSPNQTIHEMPTGKIGVYNRFFDVHNIEPTVGLFRCFYVNSKNKGWMSFSKRPDSDAVCYTKPFDSHKQWNDHFFWVDSFACPTSFPWHTNKKVSRDPFPKSTEFNTDHYDILVVHPASFWKFLEPFLCLVGMNRYYTLDEDTYPSFLHDDRTDMDLLDFIQVADPTKFRSYRFISARADSELEASVDRIIADENVVADKPKRPRKKRQAVADASGSSHPLKKLRGDNGTSSGAATGGKSLSVHKELLASNMLNVESGIEAVATLPLVTSSVSVTPEHESGVPTDSITGLNLRTIGASERFVISSDSSHHSSTNASGAEADSVIRYAVVPPVMTEAVITSHAVNAPSVLVLETGIKIPSPVYASMFHDSDSTEIVKSDTTGPSYSVKQDLSMGSRELNSETLHQVFIPQWNVLNDSLLDDYDVSQEFVNHLAPPAFERKTLESECEKQAGLLKAKDDKVENLKAQLLLKETEAAEAARLHAQVSAAKATEKMHAIEIDALKQRNDLELKDLNVAVSSLRSQKDGLVDQVHALETTCSSIRNQVAKLDAGLLKMALHLEEKFYPHLLTIISDRRWLLTHGLKLVVVKCLNSQEYLSALGAAISRAIEKGCRMDCRPVLTTERQDASTADVMDLLRLEGPLANAPGMSDLQPDNVAAQQSTLTDVWVPLVDPLSAKSLICETSTSDSVLAVVVTTTALFTTFASASSVPPITIEDYEIVGTDGPEDAQGSSQGNVASFPTVEFEKEELDTTLERDPPS